MKPLDEAGSTPRCTRIADSVWDGVEALARVRGVNPSDVVRDALDQAIENAGDAVRSAPAIPVRRPLKWMQEQCGPKRQGHACEAVELTTTRNRSGVRKPGTERLLRMRDVCAGTAERPCSQAWKRQPGKWLLIRVPHGLPDSWDLRERLNDLRGAVDLGNGNDGPWTALPRSEFHQVERVFGAVAIRFAVHLTNA